MNKKYTSVQSYVDGALGPEFSKLYRVNGAKDLKSRKAFLKNVLKLNKPKGVTVTHFEEVKVSELLEHIFCCDLRIIIEDWHGNKVSYPSNEKNP